MSIELDPSLYDYAAAPDQCPACFDANQTPESLFCCLAGIEIGAIWAPGDDPPPNGIFEINPVAACDFRVVGPPISITLQWAGGASGIQVLFNGMGLAFVGASANPCYMWFANQFNAPAGRRYWGGHCFIANCLPGSDFNEIDFLDLIDDELYGQSWSKPVPIAADIVYHRISRAIDGTNIYVKIDHS